MPVLSISEEVVARAKAAIAAEMEHRGPNADWLSVRARFPEVPKPTFYRWVKAADVGGKGFERAAREVKKAAAERKARPKPTKLQRIQAVVELEAELPAVVTMADLQTDGFSGVVSRIEACVTHAERVLKACEKEDGSIRMPKLYLQASNHILRSMDTASRVVGVLMDAERTRKYNEIMLRRIAARDPEVVRLILADMRALNEQLGVAIG